MSEDVELLKALTARYEDPQSPGHTSDELSRTLNLGPTAVRSRLKKLKAQGRLKVNRVKRLGIDDRVHECITYELVNHEKTSASSRD